MSLHRSLTVGLLASVTACSPYVYKDGITRFSSDMTSVLDQEGSAASEVRVQSSKLQAVTYAAVRQPIKSDPAGCLLPDGIVSAGCRIVADDDGGDAADAASPVALHAGGLRGIRASFLGLTKADADRQRLFAALRDYALGLAALANASDQANYDAAVTTLSSSIAAGVKAGSGGSAGDSAAAQAVAKFVGAIGGIYLEQRRYTALRSAVTTVEAVTMPVFGRDLGTTLAAQRGALLDYDRYRLAQIEPGFSRSNARRMSQEEYTVNYARMQTVIDDENRLYAADPTVTVKTMLAAHHELAQALRNGDGQFAAFSQALDSFSAQVSALGKSFSGSRGSTVAKTAETGPDRTGF